MSYLVGRMQKFIYIRHQPSVTAPIHSVVIMESSKGNGHNGLFLFSAFRMQSSRLTQLLRDVERPATSQLSTHNLPNVAVKSLSPKMAV